MPYRPPYKDTDLGDVGELAGESTRGWRMIERRHDIDGSTTHFVQREKRPGVYEQRFSPCSTRDRYTAFGPDPDILSIRSAPPPRPAVRVTLSPKARSMIRDYGALSCTSGLEYGGLLYGRVGDGRIEVVHALERSRHNTARSVSIDYGASSGRLDDTTLLGDFHCHPAAGQPSNVDKAGWEREYRRARSSTTGAPWLGVIAMAEKWQSPRLEAFLTDLDGTRAVALN
jgi:hypothetical protein